MRRGPVALTVVLVLIFSSAAFAQNDADLKKRVFEAYDALDGVILPPELNRNVAANGIDLSRDNLGEVKKFLESTPDAPLICAALFAGGFGTRSISGVHQLRFAELDLCMSHRPTQEQSEKVRPWVLPPPPSRRESIASTFVPHDFSRFVDGGYSQITWRAPFTDSSTRNLSSPPMSAITPAAPPLSMHDGVSCTQCS